MEMLAIVVLLAGMSVPIVLVFAAMVVYAVVFLVLVVGEFRDRWAPRLSRYVVAHVSPILHHPRHAHSR
jgi:hypothetical protein